MNVETLQPGALPDSKLPDSTLPDSTLVDVPGVPWQPTSFAGIDWKILMENESGMRTVLMRWAPGARLPYHEHVALEQTFVLEGSFSDHSGTCSAGQYVWRRTGSRHDAWTDEGCLMIAFFLKPNTFFD